LDKDYRLCCNFFIILYLKEGHNKYQVVSLDLKPAAFFEESEYRV